MILYLIELHLVYILINFHSRLGSGAYYFEFLQKAFDGKVVSTVKVSTMIMRLLYFTLQMFCHSCSGRHQTLANMWILQIAILQWPSQVQCSYRARSHDSAGSRYSVAIEQGQLGAGTV